MSDTELLIKTLLHQARLHNKQGANGLGLLFTNAAKEIEKLQAENAELKKQSQWVSVDDELPSDSGAYWTFNGLDENKTVIQQRVHMYDSEHKYFNSYTVTHWMPLPTPPEGE